MRYGSGMATSERTNAMPDTRTDGPAMRTARKMHRRQIHDAAIILRHQGADALAGFLEKAGPDGKIDAVLAAMMVDAAYYQRPDRDPAPRPTR